MKHSHQQIVLLFQIHLERTHWMLGLCSFYLLTSTANEMQVLYWSKDDLIDIKPSWLTGTFYKQSFIILCILCHWEAVHISQRKLSIKTMISWQKVERYVCLIAMVAAGISSKLWESKAGFFLMTQNIRWGCDVMYFAVCEVITHQEEHKEMCETTTTHYSKQDPWLGVWQ